MLHITEYSKNVYHVYDDFAQSNLNLTFVRFQEHYESPEWKDKIFTLGQYREWYTKKYGGWTYATDWTGFNIPSYVLTPFFDGLFDPLTREEEVFMDKILRLRFNHDPKERFYVIGAQMGAIKTMVHEVAHAHFYNIPEYADRVNAICREFSVEELAPYMSYFNSRGYHESVWIDELQANIIDGGGTMPAKILPDLGAKVTAAYKSITGSLV